MGLEDKVWYREMKQEENEKNIEKYVNPLNISPPPATNKSHVWLIIISVFVLVWGSIILMYYIIPMAFMHSIVNDVNLLVSELLKPLGVENVSQVSQLNNSSKVPQLNTSNNQLTEQPLPVNGSSRIFYPPENYVALLTMKSDSENNYLVKLVDNSDKPILYLFVRAKDSAIIKVPFGKYKLEWVSGKRWYGYDDMFGLFSTFHKADQILDFHEQNISVNGKKVIMNTVVTFNDMMGNMPLVSVQPVYLGN
jgi:hypothetical protein